jgi:transcription antitermination factor NusG
MAKRNEVVWYPLRVTYSREIVTKEYLEKENIECFLPMHYEEKMIDGGKKRKLVPVVHNLLFVHSSRKKIDELKSESPLASLIRYIMNPEKNEPIIIPEKQMQDFIAVAGTVDEQIMYLSSTEIALKKGCMVRINGGIWKGVKGRFVRFKRNLHVVVEIKGIMAVATASLHPSLVDKIEESLS